MGECASFTDIVSCTRPICPSERKKRVLAIDRCWTRKDRPPKGEALLPLLLEYAYVPNGKSRHNIKRVLRLTTASSILELGYEVAPLDFGDSEKPIPITYGYCPTLKEEWLIEGNDEGEIARFIEERVKVGLLEPVLEVTIVTGYFLDTTVMRQRPRGV